MEGTVAAILGSILLALFMSAFAQPDFQLPEFQGTFFVTVCCCLTLIINVAHIVLFLSFDLGIDLFVSFLAYYKCGGFVFSNEF